MANEVMISFSELQQMAATMAKSGMFGKTPEQMLSLMMIAQAENLHPALAAMEYDIIQGRPALKGQAALARFQQAGGSVKWITRSDVEATAVFFHPKGGELKVTWDVKKAKAAGLWDKRGRDGQETPWQKIPGVMLSWRTIAEGVRAVYPACLNRMYLAEEVQDFEPMRNVSPDENPESFVKIAETASNLVTTDEGKQDDFQTVDWVAKAAELTEKHGIDPKMKAAIWKDCGATAEGYCRKVEEIMAAATAATEPESQGDDFQLSGDDPMELVAVLEEYAAVDGLPAAAKKDIDAALARNERDYKTLAALIEKVKSALNG